MGMSRALTNPELPPGAIVETYEDGGALRNDGVKLTPASQNPWYVLATVAGEPEGISEIEIDHHLHAKNRRFWNGWMCQGTEEGERVALAEKLDLPEEELKPLDAEEMAKVKERFVAAFPDKPPEEMIPVPDAIADFRRVYFPSTFVLGKCHFAELSFFPEAHFTGDAVFQEAHFAGHAVFQKAHFTGGADFREAHFTGLADFREAHFTGLAVFQKAHFTGGAYFQEAHFTGLADFQEAQFNKGADFSDGCFKSQTVFDGATFRGEVPKFFQREMHQDTGFTDDPKFWPEVTAKNAKKGKRAYTRLRQVAAEIYDPDLEHFFLRREMRCKARIEWDRGAWFHWLFFEAYRVIADSGISVARPALGLLVAWLGPGFLYLFAYAGRIIDGAVALSPLGSFGLSFANLFSFLGLNRLYFAELIKNFGFWLSRLAGAQTVAGVVLLFFLGLGLRNRFRLK